MQTIITSNDNKTLRIWATGLSSDVFRSIYFAKFIGKSKESVIQEKTQLQDESGDKIQFDLLASFQGEATWGDDVVEGKGEALKYRTDEVVIDLVRHAANAGSRMTRKRTIHDVRQNARDNLKKYWREWLDEMYFAVLSGAVGVNEDNKIRDFSKAPNALIAPDADHIMYAGSATSKASLEATHKVSRDLIERLRNRALMMNARDPENAQMNPVTVGGRKHFVFLMNPDQVYDLRMEAGDAGWAKIQREAGPDGEKNPIFTDKLGMLANVVLHEHSNVKRFSDYGAGANVHAARALFLGCQAAVVAYGGGGGKTKMIWSEQFFDHGNQVEIAAGPIVGAKKVRFAGAAGGTARDFGVIAVDTAAKDPMAA